MRTLIILMLFLLPACHTTTPAPHRITNPLTQPPASAPDRAPRDLIRAAPRLLAHLPDAPPSDRWLGIVLFNHAGEPVARAIIYTRPDAAPLIALEQIQPDKGWQQLDAPEFKDSPDDAKRTHAKLANAGPAARSIDDTHTLRLTIPGSTDDDELWLTIPLTPDSPHAPQWSYSNDFGSIAGGPLSAYSIKQTRTR